MMRLRTRGRLLSLYGVGVACLGLIPPASAQQQPPASNVPAASARPETIVLQALRADPITAPYPIATSWRAGQVVLSGRVGTKVVHDTAVRIGIATGYSIRDDLKIDTSEVYRVAAAQAAANPAGPPLVGTGGLVGVNAAPYYVYPPPLFGWIDDPFYGFEPPLVSYPPWWGMVAAREGLQNAPPMNLGPPVAEGPIEPGQEPNAPTPMKVPVGPSSEDGTVEMTIDTRGVAVLRGTVPTLKARVEIGQKIMQVPGVTQVINLLNVGSAGADSPPPPPQPAEVPAAKEPGKPAPAAAPAPATAPPPALSPEPAPVGPPLKATVSADDAPLAQRLTRTFQNRPVLAELPIKVAVRDGTAYLSGEVPTVYEAMLAFRAVQQTPGIRDVDDRLQFVVPDGERRNPLQLKGRPEDVEPYLTAQIRRQLGDLAHVDQVQVQGDTLEIKGTLLREDERERLDAILRSIPVLRGYRLEPTFVVE